MNPFRSKLALLISFAAAALTPSHAFAQAEEQDAPMGAHHASGADTGGGRGYATSIPLDLPSARGGLPVPVRLTLGGTRMGAMGRGGDVQLSFITDSATFAQLRPLAAVGQPAVPRRRVTLSLMGEQMDLILKAADFTGDTWVPQRGHPELIVRKTSPTNWTVYSGDGLIYVFDQPNAALQPLNLYLLDRIVGPGNARVQLSYRVVPSHVTPAPVFSANPLPMAGYDAVSIDLERVRYNYSAGGSPKHELGLAYDADRAQPLSVGATQGGVIIRKRALQAVQVFSRAFEYGALTRLAEYSLAYTADPDTGLPRLSKVTMTGREGTPEASTSLPVAQYEFGTATTPVTLPDGSTGAQLRYEQLPLVSVPNGAAYQFVSQSKHLGGRYVVPQQLVDVTGDGRVDVVFETGSGLRVGKNRPGTAGAAVLNDPALNVPFGGGQMTKPFLDSTGQAVSLDPYTTDYPEEATDKTIDTWTQLIDINGDGRPDYIDASEVPDAWVVYLNVPSSSSPQNISWVRRQISISRLRQQIVSHGNRLATSYVPLMRQYVTGTLRAEICWRYDRSVHDWRTVFDAEACSLYGGFPNSYPKLHYTGSSTAVAWKLADFNSDGAIDLLLRSKAPHTEIVQSRPCLDAGQGRTPQPGYPGCYEPAPGEYADRVRNRLYVANTTGTLEVAFNHQDVAAIFPIANAIPVGGCGPGHWGMTRTDSGVKQSYEICGLADIDGDGLLDSVQALNPAQLETTRVVFLGTGGRFSSAYYALPGPSDYSPVDYCSGQSGSYTAETRIGYRDLTGDGIPDAVSHLNVLMSGGIVVRVGTGAGFGPPISVAGSLDGTAGHKFVLSTSSNACDQGFARTTSGWYDVDGDGRLEKVQVSGFGLDIHRLVGRRGSVPESRSLSAGLLIAIENGHGGRTEIGYRSAKDDGSTLHQLPFPEIVVASVRTWQKSTGLAADRLFAYGDARFDFDSLKAVFRSYGYGRTVSATIIGPGRDPNGLSRQTIATITDANPVVAPQSTTDVRSAFARHLIAGQPKRVTALSGDLPDVWALLTADVHSDARVVGASDLTYDVKHFVVPPLPSDVPGDGCTDATDPYAGATSTSMNTCKTYGFVFSNGVNAWRGRSGPPSDLNVMTHSRVLNVDDFGRVTRAFLGNDARRADDNVCIQTTYPVAQPAAAGAPWDGRVLVAPTRVEVVSANTDGVCTGLTLSRSVTVYDGLPTGQVAKGWVTRRFDERRETQTGVLLDGAAVLGFDATYDALGNVEKVSSDSGDGRSRVITYSYDVFGLVPVSSKVTATGAQTQGSFVNYDPVTLLPSYRENPTGTRLGMTYDGFGREVLATVIAPGGMEGALSVKSYLGFMGGDPHGRRVSQTTFDAPVALGAVASAVGHTQTTSFDDWGRTTRTVVDLGVDYTDDLVVKATAYDAFGRVTFDADPFHTGQNESTAYGTSYFYERDGQLRAAVRGYGKQALPAAMFGSTNEALERYPTYFLHDFSGGEELTTVYAADALLPGSPQYGVSTQVRASAVGRRLSNATWSPSARLEHSDFKYDLLGNAVTTRRYRLPGNALVAPSDPVEMTFGYDSFGQLLRQIEPATVQRDFAYSDWGELLETRTPSSTIGPTPARSALWKYDGLGRLTHTAQRSNSSVLAGTVYNYAYDSWHCPFEAVESPNTLGRLSWARSATSDACLGYDDYGNQNATTWRDPNGERYHQVFTLDADGAPNAMAMVLSSEADIMSAPAEHMKYVYDSARRLRSSEFIDRLGNKRQLFAAKQVDAFGRLREGFYGGAHYAAAYADVGRRLFFEDELLTPSGQRRAVFINGYDPVGRERGRTEKTETDGDTIANTYDALGRVARSIRSGPRVKWDRALSFDALGNMLQQTDGQGTQSVSMRYGPVNGDQLCSVGYGVTAPATCNVVHDGNGNVTRQPSGLGVRELGFLPSGQVASIQRGFATAALRYDAFGDVQEIDVVGPVSETRRDRRYGLVEQRMVIAEGTTTQMRSFPIGDSVATLRGPTDQWTIPIGEQRGNRFFVNQDGKLVQEVDYLPFGEVALADGAKPTSRLYSREQWNGGDNLDAFGISQLGVRMYDPVVGRFLSPDPLLLMGGAGDSNPYAFAASDPVNFSDPSGLCVEGLGCPGGSQGNDVGNPLVSGREVSPRPPAPPKLDGSASSIAHFAAVMGGVGKDPLELARYELMLFQRGLQQYAMDRSREGLDRMCEVMPQSCDSTLEEGGAASAGRLIISFVVPTVTVPSYYLRASDRRVLHFDTMSDTGAYMQGRSDELARRTTVAMGRVNERVGLLTHVLSGANGISSSINKIRAAMGRVAASGMFARAGRGVVQAAGSGCFSGDTLVQTAAGLKAISVVSVGDSVWAFDAGPGAWGWHAVTNTMIHEYSGPMVVLQHGDEQILATPNHPVCISAGAGLDLRSTPPDIGDDPAGCGGRGRWVEAGDLEEGDVGLGTNADATIARVSAGVQSRLVYNLQIENAHTYVVGALGLLVHNKPMYASDETLATYLGYKIIRPKSNGQAVFQKGRLFITRDIPERGGRKTSIASGHNGGMWKMADSVKNLGRKETRMGTYDLNLNWIGE